MGGRLESTVYKPFTCPSQGYYCRDETVTKATWGRKGLFILCF